MIASSLSTRLKAMEDAGLDLEDFVVTVWIDGKLAKQPLHEGRAHHVAIDHDDTGLTRTIVIVEDDVTTALIPESKVQRIEIREDAE